MVPGWAIHFPFDSITRAASAKGLDPLLVAAFVGRESSGVQWKTRYEKGWRYFHKPEVFAGSLGISVETETIAQATSYGLIQIMGGTARSLGYCGYLSALVDVDRGLDWGCELLANLKAKYGDVRKVAAAYNAGSPRLEPDGSFVNEGYVEDVLRRYAELRGQAVKPVA